MKKNILFLVQPALRDVNSGGIYPDLAKTLIENGHDLTIVSPLEARDHGGTTLKEVDQVTYLYVKTGNLTKNRSKIKKGIALLSFEFQLYGAVKKYLRNKVFDLIIYPTPPITIAKTVRYVKNRDHAKTYLMLKDIFPQNAVDLEMIQRNSFLYRYFKRKERQLYTVSDKIGCMSHKNIEFLAENEKYVQAEKLELFPNAIRPCTSLLQNNHEDARHKKKLFQKFGLDSNKILLFYGGNLGKPQAPNVIKEFIQRIEDLGKVEFLLIGDGTEYEDIENVVKNSKNTRIYKRIPEKEYREIVRYADICLVFLDHRFTIPNFPQRILRYMEYSKPIFAATDQNTDIKDLLEKNQIGFWANSKDAEGLYTLVRHHAHEKERLKKLGENGRAYLEKNFDIRKNVQRLVEF